jgi:glycosyltransferase involved in cell wall biosynthesis
MPSLSVIIPTYNAEATIAQCLSSLLNQSFQDFEICIIDGESTDQTIEIVRQYQSKFKAIKLISEVDKGVYDAMNKGIHLASGDWLYFLGSDDTIYDRGVFSDVMRLASTSELQVIYGNVCMLGTHPDVKSGQIYDGLFDIDKLASRNICHQAIFYRSKVFQKYGKYKNKYPVYADWEMNLRLFPKIRFAYYDRLIANFNLEGLSARNIADPFREDLIHIKKYLFKEYKIRRWLYQYFPLSRPTLRPLLKP